MKIKLDENIGRRGAELLKAAGHDVMTVRDQNLQGAPDETVFRVCADEARILITLDHDFGKVLRFPPERSAGLVVLEPGARVTAQSLLNRLRDFLTLAEAQSPSGPYGSLSPDGFAFISRVIDKERTSFGFGQLGRKFASGADRPRTRQRSSPMSSACPRCAKSPRRTTPPDSSAEAAVWGLETTVRSHD